MLKLVCLVLYDISRTKDGRYTVEKYYKACRTSVCVCVCVWREGGTKKNVGGVCRVAAW